ncbi:hypothetical protein BKA83DRAFT_4500641 [Pisolithus microcarpus]|nr:hypothetical protein BKA83DRAFT_4500641 [Pisolithus microcarpus]
MTCKRVIMLKTKHSEAEVIDVGDEDAAVEVEETIGIQGPSRGGRDQEMSGRRRVGSIKDHKNVSIKWGAIKQTYNVIITYHSKSGKHWDNEHGTNISGALAGENWSKYVAVKGNALMRPFCNKGWEYMDFLEDIFLQGGATSMHAFHAGTSQYTVPTASTEDSSSTPVHFHSTPATSPASFGPAAPASNLPISNPPISNPPAPNSPAPNSPAPNPPTSNSGGKHLFTAMSSEVVDMTSPSLLFLDNRPPQTLVSVPPTGKHSRMSAQLAGKAKPQASQASHMVAVIAIDNTIWCLGDQLATMFMDPLIAVQMTTTMLYKDPEMPAVHCSFMMHQFTGNSNSAVAYISLPDDKAQREYVADMYVNWNEVGVSGAASQNFILQLHLMLF